MALTPEEARELAALDRQEAEFARTDAVKAKMAMARPGVPTMLAKPPEPFALSRMVMGGVRDAAENVLALNDELAKTLNPIPRVARVYNYVTGNKTADAGADANAAVASVVSNATAQRLGLTPHVPIENLAGSENAGTVEKVGRAITSFIIPYAGVAKAAAAWKATSIVAKGVKGVSLASVVNFAAMDATENNLANILKNDFKVKSDVIDALATEEDDDLFEARLKMTLSNVPLDLGGEVVFAGMAGVARLYRSLRKGNEATRAVVDNTLDTLEDVHYEEAFQASEVRAAEEAAIEVEATAAKAAAAADPGNVAKKAAADAANAKIEGYRKETVTWRASLREAFVPTAKASQDVPGPMSVPLNQSLDMTPAPVAANDELALEGVTAIPGFSPAPVNRTVAIGGVVDIGRNRAVRNVVGGGARKAANDIPLAPVTDADTAAAKAKIGPFTTKTPKAPAEPAALPTDMVTVPRSALAPVRVSTFKEAIDAIRNQLDAVTLEWDDATLAALGKDILDNPTNAFSRLGIDSTKLDLSDLNKLDEQTLQGLMDTAEAIADKLAEKSGRTGTTVSMAQTAKAANELSMSVANLMSLGDLKGLASRLTGARMLVGAHAGKMLETAKAARAGIRAGTTAEWDKFLLTYSEHVALYSVVRGASSEVGRALHSLRSTIELKADAWDPVTRAAESFKVKVNVATAKTRALTANAVKVQKEAYAVRVDKEAQRQATKRTATEAKEALQAVKDAQKVKEAARVELLRIERDMSKASDAILNRTRKAAEKADADFVKATALAETKRVAAEVAIERTAYLEKEYARVKAIFEQSRQAVRDDQAAQQGLKWDHPALAKLMNAISLKEVDDVSLNELATASQITVNDVLAQIGIPKAAYARLKEASTAYDDMFKHLATPASRDRMITQLLDAKGDLRALNKLADRESLTWLNHADAWVRDTIGNIWTTGTATLNTVGGASIVAGKALTHAMAGLVELPLAKLGIGNELAARQNLLQAWGTLHGFVSGWDQALENTKAIIGRDLYEEAARTVDNLGMNNVAAKLQAKSGDYSDIVLSSSARVRAETATSRSITVTAEQVEAARAAIGDMNGPAVMKAALAWTVRLGAAAVQVVGGVTRAGTTLLINAPDQLIGTMAARAGAHAEAVLVASREAAEAGLSGKDTYAYIGARSREIADGIEGLSEDPFTDGIQEAASREARERGESYAETVLFQDDLQWTVSNAAVGLSKSIPIVGSLVLPIIRTPMRVLERTLLDYTPLGALKASVRDAIVAGGPAARSEYFARMAASTTAMVWAFNAVEDRTIVGFDGGVGSAARLSRGSYSLKIGGDVVEFNRLDPIGTILGFAVDIREYTDRRAEDWAPGEEEHLEAAVEAFFWATFKNVLSKTWMVSLRMVNEMAAAQDEEAFGDKLAKYTASMAGRFVPGSGIQRSLELADDPVTREASGFVEGIMKASFGAGELPARRDAFLGRPVEETLLRRTVGMRGGPLSTDPLLQELDELGPRLPAPSRSIVPRVRMDSRQFSRLLELQGQIVTDETGMTLEAQTRAIIADPEYQKLVPQQRLEVLKKARSGYRKLATDALLQEDKELAFKALNQETWDTFSAAGRTSDESREETRKTAKALGLPVPSDY